MSFTIKGIHPHDIATILDDDGVAIRAGHHCCQILHDKLGIPASTQELQLEFITTKMILMFYVSQLTNVKKYFKI